MMEVKLLYFGMVRDLVQRDEENMDVQEDSTVGHLKDVLFEKHEKLRAFDNFAVAVNESYADPDQRLQPGDVVALIPPVSGG